MTSLRLRRDVFIVGEQGTPLLASRTNLPDMRLMQPPDADGRRTVSCDNVN